VIHPQHPQTLAIQHQMMLIIDQIMKDIEMNNWDMIMPLIEYTRCLIKGHTWSNWRKMPLEKRKERRCTRCGFKSRKLMSPAEYETWRRRQAAAERRRTPSESKPTQGSILDD
jgi:hypothetical protein